MSERSPNPFAPQRPSTRRSQTRPPRLRSFPVKPTGPRLLDFPDDYGKEYLGFGPAPPGFLTYTNSYSEWVIYAALARVLGVPKDPRQPPFTGWPGIWTYQRPFEGGRIAGGQVVDFLIDDPSATSSGAIAIRITTERYHIFTDAAKQATDRILLARLSGRYRVVDIYEQDFISDPSGQAAVIEVKRALFGGATSNPLRSGQARRIRA